MNPVQQAADFLLQARLSQFSIENIPAEFHPHNEVDAYGIQDLIVNSLARQSNSRFCGYKLACTNHSIMQRLNVESPFSGQLLSHSTHTSGTTLVAEDFFRRVVEVEFAFTMAEDAIQRDRPYDVESIQPLIKNFMPSIEVVDYRYRDFTRVGANALIADNAIHGASILGSCEDEHWRQVDLADHPVALWVNDTIQSQGCGRNVLGHPFIVIAWLANHLIRRGMLLKKGDIVSTGSACDVYYAHAGDRITADFGVLGNAYLTFS